MAQPTPNDDYDPRFLIRPFFVMVEGFGRLTFHATSRGKALAAAWESYNGAQNPVSFARFMAMAKAVRGEADRRFGEAILVGGRPAFFVAHDSHYVQFALPDSPTISKSHHLDMQPVT